MIRFTPYAEAKMQKRRLPRHLVERAVASPQQLLEEDYRKVAQSRYTDSETGKEYLLRVIYEQVGDDALVITAYRTSKIQKYWRR